MLRYILMAYSYYGIDIVYLWTTYRHYDRVIY